jgi:microcystin-dependent protein
MHRVASQAFLCAALGALPQVALAQSLTGQTGGGQPFDNGQPALVLNYIIALEGVFPSRNDPVAVPSPGIEPTAGGGEPFLGEVIVFAGNFAPRGWAFAQGQLLPIADNTALFALLGTTYGGDGQTTFALPDLRGRTAVGQGAGAGLTARQLGEPVGAEQVNLTEVQMPTHAHSVPGSIDPTGDSGGGLPHDTMQPSLAMNYAVPLQGIYLSRNDAVGATQDGVVVAGFSEPYLGAAGLFAFGFAPRGYALADGRLLPIAENTALFSLLGTTYGGNGQTTFALPDLRGRTALSEGNGPGLTPRTLGESLGVEAQSLLIGQLPSHDHTLPGAAATTGDTGGNLPVNAMQPSLTLNYIIALEGIFPSRNDPAAGAPTDIGPLVAGAEPFLGEIELFAGNFAPRGWALAQGQILPIDQNTALFSLLGTTYGGDGQTTFALPDLRGRTIIGAGTGPGLTTRNLGDVVGVEQVMLSIDQMPAHRHTVVPEPATVVLTAIGFAAVFLNHLRRQGKLANSARM